MNFISIAFLLLYLTALLLRWTVGKQKREGAYIAFLILLSLVFYSWYVPLYLLLLLYTCIVAYGFGVLKKDLISKWTCSVAVVLLLLPLIFYKYYDFILLKLVNPLAGTKMNGLEMLLPIGISFYTFQAISYVVDVYRDDLRSKVSFRDLMLFISFFPQLVAGPIVKAKEFLYQVKRKRAANSEAFWYGGYLLIRGFFLKFVCADNIAPLIDSRWSGIAQTQTLSPEAVLLVVGFSFQIFYDFAGYTDIARGVAYQLGFRLPENFNCPYIATSFSGFWRRWHISLSEWFRDYLYIPLGGNRKGSTRTTANLLVVMLLCGLWHGAAWTFVLWGALHGLYLVVERTFWSVISRSRSTRFVWFVVVQAGVLFAWVFFRATSLPEGWRIVRSLFHPEAIEFHVDGVILKLMLLMVPGIAIHVVGHLRESVHSFQLLAQRHAVLSRSAFAGVLFYFILSAYGSASEFIYFQF